VKGIRPLAVVAGLLVAGVAYLALKFGAVTVIWLAHQTSASALWWALMLLVVGLSEAGGGFVAARMSKLNPLGAAIAVGILDLLGASWFVLRPGGLAWDWWMSLIYLALIVPSALAGGHLARSRTA